MKPLILGLLIPLGLVAQQQCQQTGSLTTATSGANLDNRVAGCSYFRLTYWTVQTSAISISIQGAQDIGGSPGTYGNFATVVAGANPSTTIGSGTIVVNGYYPWVSVSVGTLTGGTVKWTLVGQNGPNSASAATGFAASNIAAPYLVAGGHKYVITTGYLATLPPASPTWLNSVIPSTVTAGTNGDLYIGGSGAYWSTQTATVSSESEFAWSAVNSATGDYGNAGVWLYDNTNGIVWYFYIDQISTSPTAIQLGLDKYTCSSPCTAANPAYSSTIVKYNWGAGTQVVHLKIAVVSTVLLLYYSLDGGVTYTVITPGETVGTVTQGGFAMNGGSNTNTMDIFSSLVL